MSSISQSVVAPVPRLAVSVKEFCQSVGIGRTKFYQLVRDDLIKTIQVGRRRLVSTSELHRFIAG